ncbi:MAG: hypothetical protein ABSG43_14525 [Solirubrobacteraceae bacterium]|jgi:hypothetical protein
MRPASRDLPPQPDEQTLLDEMWRISHFGWMPQAAIRRSLTISSGHETPAAALAERLHQLLQRRWVEQRDGDAGTNEPEWRLTDSGRPAS